MLRLFWGMVLGAAMTMFLLGGVSAADQVIANTQALYLGYLNKLDVTTTLTLLVSISIFIGALSLWPAKPAVAPKKVIQHLRRHC